MTILCTIRVGVTIQVGTEKLEIIIDPPLIENRKKEGEVENHH